MGKGSNDQVAKFREYVLGDTSSTTHSPRDRREAIKYIVPQRWRTPLRRAATRAITPVSWLRARRLLRADGPVRLHLGAGFLYEPGWINVDLLGPKTDLAWDLTRPLPLPPDSVDAICHQHLISMLTLRHGLALTEECRRLLRPDGVLRIAVIDGGKCLDSYSQGEEQPARTAAPTPMLSIDALFYDLCHRVLYDARTLVMLCRAAGFLHVEVSEYRAGRLTPNIDEPSRRAISIYVEAWG